PLRRAVIAGCGSMARGWVAALGHADLVDRVTIVGLADVDVDAAARLRDEKGLSGVQIGSDLATMLSATEPDLLFDVVVLGSRRAVVERGLSAGCHVLSEKPMASSLDEAQHLIHLAAQAGRFHAVVQNRRYTPGVRRIRRLIDSGALGELTAI